MGLKVIRPVDQMGGYNRVVGIKSGIYSANIFDNSFIAAVQASNAFVLESQTPIIDMLVARDYIGRKARSAM